MHKAMIVDCPSPAILAMWPIGEWAQRKELMTRMEKRTPVATTTMTTTHVRATAIPCLTLHQPWRHRFQCRDIG